MQRVKRGQMIYSSTLFSIALHARDCRLLIYVPVSVFSSLPPSSPPHLLSLVRALSLSLSLCLSQYVCAWLCVHVYVCVFFFFVGGACSAFYNFAHLFIQKKVEAVALGAEILMAGGEIGHHPPSTPTFRSQIPSSPPSAPLGAHGGNVGGYSSSVDIYNVRT